MKTKLDNQIYLYITSCKINLKIFYQLFSKNFTAPLSTISTHYNILKINNNFRLSTY